MNISTLQLGYYPFRNKKEKGDGMWEHLIFVIHRPYCLLHRNLKFTRKTFPRFFFLILRLCKMSRQVKETVSFFVLSAYLICFKCKTEVSACAK